MKLSMGGILRQQSAILIAATSVFWIGLYWLVIQPRSQVVHLRHTQTASLDEHAARSQPAELPSPPAFPEQSSAWSRNPSISARADNPLYQYFLQRKSGPRIHKWSPYFDVYDRYFARFRNQPVRFLEIGVQSGGSIGMWKHYFGPQLSFFGIDINPYCKALFGDLPQVTIITGDQSNETFWDELIAKNIVFDVILDDGGHKMEQQITTFQKAWKLLADGGVWITEDTATSYDLAMGAGTTVNSGQFGGGYGKSSTWMEYVKKHVIDVVNGHYILQNLHPDFDSTRLRDSVLSIAQYDQMVVLEKGHHPKAKAVSKGDFSMPYNLEAKSVDPTLLDSYKARLDEVGRV